MWERFTERALKVMRLANQEARRRHRSRVGTEHILLALVKEGTGVGATALRNLGGDPRRAQSEVEGPMMAHLQPATVGKLPLSRHARNVVEYATMEARNLGHDHVGTEHVLLGLLRERDGVAGQVLTNMGMTIEPMRQEIHRLLSSGLSEKMAPEGAADEEEDEAGLDEVRAAWPQLPTILRETIVAIVRHATQQES